MDFANAVQRRPQLSTTKKISSEFRSSSQAKRDLKFQDFESGLFSLQMKITSKERKV